jgi:nucleoside-diphosphate-sugar epimerase
VAGPTLVTGASGFIGAHLVAHLRAQGDDVVPVLGPRSGSTDSASRTVDLGDEGAIADLVRDVRPRRTFHLAWQADAKTYLHDIDDHLVSARFSLALVQHLLAAGCTELVVAGSCAEYEPRATPLGEDAPTRPRILYGSAKLAVATAAVPSAAAAGASLAWARVFHVYGPGEDCHRHVPRLVLGRLHDPDQAVEVDAEVRDYLHVGDVASALVHLADRRWHGPVNVCGGTGVTLSEIWERLDHGVGDGRRGTPPEVPDGADTTTVVGDPSLLHTLGWRPTHTLDSGLADSVAWWREQA